jgi:ketosteroid isomerase-like protein
MPPFYPTKERNATMDAGEVHRRIVEQWDAVLAGRMDDALALLDPDVIDHRGGSEGDHIGVDAWREKWEGFAVPGAFDEVGVTIEQNVVAGDTSANRYTSRGRHIETGRRYAVTGLDMVRVRDGRIVEHWALMDLSAMRVQIGLDPQS